MSSRTLDWNELAGVGPLAPGSVCVGRIVEITLSGQALVDFPGNVQGAVPARATASLKHAELFSSPVLLVFENGDFALPIIIGIVKDNLVAPRDLQKELRLEHLDELAVDGKKLVLEASREITLRCGKSSLTLNKDGRVIIRGVDIVSRASRVNKIRGGAVAIN